MLIKAALAAGVVSAAIFAGSAQAQLPVPGGGGGGAVVSNPDGGGGGAVNANPDGGGGAANNANPDGASGGAVVAAKPAQKAAHAKKHSKAPSAKKKHR